MRARIRSSRGAAGESPRRAREALPLGRALEALLAALAEGPPVALDRLRLHWPAVCGAVIARVSEPVALEGETLRVAVDGPAWRRALEQERRRLMARLRPVAPAVRRLVFEVRPVPPPPAAAPAPPAPVVPADPRNAVVADPELRQALDALGAARDRSRDGRPDRDG